MKRIAICRTLAALLSISAFAACSGNDDNTSSVASSATVWNGTGANPCSAKNPIVLVPPSPFTGDLPNQAGIRRQTFNFALAADANACVLAQVEGATTSGDRILLDIDGTQLGSSYVCKNGTSGTKPAGCTAPGTNYSLLLPFRSTSGSHAATVYAKSKQVTQTSVTIFAQGPYVASFAPLSARQGETVTLTGEGFEATSTVWVGSTQYPVSSVSAAGDSIVVTVPQGASAGAFDVRSPLGSTQSTATFTPIFWSCSAPYQTPNYVRPADDSVAFESLAEASGYAISSNSDWVDLSAGNLCGASEKELMLIKNAHSNFSVMRGRAPFVKNTGDLVSNPSHPWRAVAVSNLSPSPINQFEYDHIVAIRHVTASGVPDLVIAQADPVSCEVSSVLATASIGNPVNSDWVDVAIGDFDGDRQKEIALLKTAHNNFFIVKYVAGATSIAFAGDLDSDPGMPWKAVTAGDLDGDGVDELVAARSVSDGVSATVLVYKWTGAGFTRIATSTFGNTGNSDWVSATIGDFNGDGRKVIALAKNEHSNFALLDLPTASSDLQVIATHDLDSVAGQEWRGVAAVDWVGDADAGAAELVAVRAAHDPYKVDLFVYGDDYHRVSRDSGLSNVKAQAYFERPTHNDPTAPCGYADQYDAWSDEMIASIKDGLLQSHSNTYEFQLRDPEDYHGLVMFLKATQDFCVDGQQLRVWAVLWPYYGTTCSVCSLPTEEPDDLTPWHESDYMAVSTATNALNGTPEHPESCNNYGGWGLLLGRLAQQYPHLNGIGFDDFSLRLDSPVGPVYQEQVAQLQANARQLAPWINFVPTYYYGNRDRLDFGRSVDSMLYFFRDESAGQSCPAAPGGTRCLEGTYGEKTIADLPRELCAMRPLLPAGRKLQLGAYFAGHSVLGTPTNFYDYKIGRVPRDHKWLGIDGFTVYGFQKPPADGCTEDDYLSHNTDISYLLSKKYCTVEKLFSGDPAPRYVSDLDLSTASCLSPQTAGGDPFAYAADGEGIQTLVYRGSDGNLYDLWRTDSAIGHTNLSGFANAPLVTSGSRPTAFVFPADGSHNIIYRGTDAATHWLSFTGGSPPVDHNVTAASGGPSPLGSPFGYSITPLGVREVLYRATDGHLHEAYWSSWPTVGHTDLTNASGAPPSTTFAPGPAGDPVGNVIEALTTNNAVYRGTDGHLHELYWWLGAVGHTDLTDNSGATAPAGDPAAYWAPNYGVLNAFYRGVDGHMHELYWSTGDVGHTNLTENAGAPLPGLSADPSAYFIPADGTNHVVYRDGSSNLTELYWTTGNVSYFNLTGYAQAPACVGKPSSYYRAGDGTQHVIYRTADGHIHELRWGD